MDVKAALEVAMARIVYLDDYSNDGRGLITLEALRDSVHALRAKRGGA